jgi:hypothetical protein
MVDPRRFNVSFEHFDVGKRRTKEIEFQVWNIKKNDHWKVLVRRGKDVFRDAPMFGKLEGRGAPRLLPASLRTNIGVQKEKMYVAEK